MCFGFLGIQFAFGLQNANTTRIFQVLGAEVDKVALLWIAAPLTGLLVQPIVGYYSDRTWTWLGRRRPYFLAGAVLSSFALVLMPRAPALWMAAGLLWVLDASINIAMEPFRAFVADLLPPKQRPAGYAMQSFFIGVGAVIASMLPWVLARAGVSNDGAIPDSVRYSFDIGAIVLFLAILWTIATTREYPPAELDAFSDTRVAAEVVRPGSEAHLRAGGAFFFAVGAIGALLVWQFAQRQELYILCGLFGAWGVALFVNAGQTGQGIFATVMSDVLMTPARMWQLMPVQFFSWLALFAMWIYATPAVTSWHFGSAVPGDAAYNEGANWVGVLFAAYNGFAAIAAVIIPVVVRRLGLSVAHALNLALGAVGIASFVVVRDPDWLILSMIGVGFAWASIVSLPYALLADSLPSRKMGVYMGIFNCGIVIPQLVAASALGAVLHGLFGGKAVYALIISGVSFLIAGVFALRVK